MIDAGLCTDLAWATDGFAGFMLVRQSGQTTRVESAEIEAFLRLSPAQVHPDPACRQCFGLGYRWTLQPDSEMGSADKPGARLCPCTGQVKHPPREMA